MENKHILFIYNGHMSYYPPFLAILDYLTEMTEYKITVITSEYEKHTQDYYEAKGVEVISLSKLEPRRGYLSRARNMYKRELVLKNRIDSVVNQIRYDILWVIGEATGLKLSSFLRDRNYILSTYELSDVRSKIFNSLATITKNAKVNVACEYNRSQIMRALYGIKKAPVVLPNKPFSHPRSKNIPCEYEGLLKGKKIILYQGHIMRERNLDGICEASRLLDDYVLVMMGGGKEYKEELKKKYPNIVFINHVNAPYHLNITSYATIGVVTYNPTSLNNIYCAPNKIWEYAGFGIPMLANDIPGLKETVDKSGAGLCIDMDDPSAILKAIEQIDANYELFSSDASKMYEKCEIGDIIEQIIGEFRS